VDELFAPLETAVEGFEIEVRRSARNRVFHRLSHGIHTDKLGDRCEKTDHDDVEDHASPKFFRNSRGGHTKDFGFIGNGVRLDHVLLDEQHSPLGDLG